MSQGERFLLDEAPETPHVHLAMDDAPLPSNVSGIVALRVFAVTPEGRPRSKALVRLTVNPGSVSAAREVEPGFHEASWILPPSPTATVEARPLRRRARPARSRSPALQGARRSRRGLPLRLARTSVSRQVHRGVIQ